MKKKLLVLFMALILCCSLVFAIAACNGTTTPGATTPEVEEETVDYLVTDVATAVLGTIANSNQDATGIYAVIDNLFGGSEGIYLEASLYVEVNGQVGQLDLAVNADGSKASNNQAFVGLSVNNIYLAQIVLDDDVIYFGDGITQEDTEWFAIDQIEKLEISEYCSLILDLVVSMNDEGGFLPNSTKTLEAEIEGIVDIVALAVPKILLSTTVGTYSAPSGFVAGDDSTYAGDYSATIDLQSISSLISDITPILSTMGVDISELLESDLLSDYADIINIVMGVLLGDGNTLDGLLNGTLDTSVTPTIEIRTSVNEDAALSAFGIYYETADESTQVAFGIKNLYIGEANSAPSNSIFPDSYSKADDIALELSLSIEVPGLAEDGAIDITGYIVPEFSVSWADYEITSTDEETGEESVREVSYVSVDLTGLYGFAYAEYDGDIIDLNVNFEEMSNGMYRLSFDLSGLFETLGYADFTDAKYYYDFDLQVVFDDMLPTGDGVVAVNNASSSYEGVSWGDFYEDLDSDNAIDSIYAVVAGIFYEGFDFGSLDFGGIISSVMSIFTEVVELAADEDIFTVGDSEEVSSVAIDFTNLISALLKTSLIDDSDLLAFIFDDFGGLENYIDSANIIDNLADLFGIKNEVDADDEVITTKGDVMAAYICQALGLEDMDATELGEYLLDDNLILDLFAGSDPIEVGAGLYADDGKELLISISFGFDIVSADDVDDIKDDMDFGGDDADTDYTDYVKLDSDGGDIIIAQLEAFIAKVFGWTVNF